MGIYGQPKKYWASTLPRVIKLATKVTKIVAKKTTVDKVIVCIINSTSVET
jgi:hypothetical protein